MTARCLRWTPMAVMVCLVLAAHNAAPVNIFAQHDGDGAKRPNQVATELAKQDSLTTRAPSSEAEPPPDGSQASVLILFEAMPVSRFRTALSPNTAALSPVQQVQLRQYRQSLAKHQQQFLAEVRRMGIVAEQRYDYTFLLNGMALSIDSAAVDRLARMPGVSGVFPDSLVHLHVADPIPVIGMDQAWQLQDRQGLMVTGEGIRIAVVDTGIDYTHPDLGGCFGPSCKVIEGYDLYNDDGDPLDDAGHGTHCAGIAAASGAMVGVAPGASLLAYKVLDANGYGSIAGMIAGMERAADPDQDPATDDAADIMSLSLGYAGTPGDPWSQAVKAAADSGILVVVAAGNQGPGYANLDSPGLEASAFTVGANDSEDMIAPFSSRGPVPGYPALIKPDLTAPGVAIESTWLGGTYAVSSGTSMAVPYVAGAAALVWQAHPGWTADMVKANLMNTALDLGLDVHTQGAGQVQVDNAISAEAVVMPGSIGLGLASTSDDQWTATRSLQITNLVAEARDYSLSLSGPLLNEDAESWPIKASLSAEQMTLGAGEVVSLTLTVSMSPAQIAPDLQRNEGLITVHSGDTSLTVPFAWQLPPLFSENRALPFALQSSYDVELGDLDGDGDLDAFFGNADYYGNPANTVWLNDGHGDFADSGQRLGNSFTWGVALGDIDGDGDLDAFAANGEVWDPQPNTVWLNDGQGQFHKTGQTLGSEVSRAVALGDLDGDGDLDAFVANGDPSYGGGEANSVWLNDGAGLFRHNGQSLGNSESQDVALGDLDGDGDLDAFVANGRPERGKGQANKVWLNNGQGVFVDSGRSLGDSISQAVVLSDLDEDGDLDAVIANGGPEVADGQPDQLWLNNGSAVFSNTTQLLGKNSSFGVAAAELFSDGHPDIFVAGYHGGNRVWLNDGAPNLTLSDPGFADESAAAVALGDVDGDGDIDALVANAIGRENRLWINRGGSSAPATASPPAPSGLQVSTISPTGLELEWQDNANDESAYHVERSAEGTTAWSEVGQLPADSTHFSDSGLACGKAYAYRVRAYRGSDGQYSPYSETAAGTTGTCPHIINLPVILAVDQ